MRPVLALISIVADGAETRKHKAQGCPTPQLHWQGRKSDLPLAVLEGRPTFFGNLSRAGGPGGQTTKTDGLPHWSCPTDLPHWLAECPNFSQGSASRYMRGA